jgi:hypothetical protein
MFQLNELGTLGEVFLHSLPYSANIRISSAVLADPRLSSRRAEDCCYLSYLKKRQKDAAQWSIDSQDESLRSLPVPSNSSFSGLEAKVSVPGGTGLNWLSQMKTVSRLEMIVSPIVQRNSRRSDD